MKWLPFAVTWGLPFVVYLVLQTTAFFVLPRGRRLAALIPILPMVGVVLATIRAYEAQSNLWPILLIFASPLADLFLVVLLLQRRRSVAGIEKT